MAETMIERVARAMERQANPQWSDEQFEAWWNHDEFFCDRVTSWRHFTGTRKQMCLHEARIAIEAMREPTEAMVDSCGNGECGKWAPGAWDNMIDAALKETN